MTRDPGLQPERTAMSWIRTLMLLFGVGLLFFKVGEVHQHYFLASLGIFCALIASASALYIKVRFTKLFTDESAVSKNEHDVKQWLTGLLLIMALGYLISMWIG